MAVRYATIKPFPIRDQLSFHKCQVMQRNGSNPSCPTARPGTTASFTDPGASSPSPPRGHTRTTRHGGLGTGLPTGWSDLGSWGAPRALACARCQFAGFPRHLFEAIRQPFMPFGKQTPITTTVSAGGISSLVRRRWLDGPSGRCSGGQGGHRRSSARLARRRVRAGLLRRCRGVWRCSRAARPSLEERESRAAGSRPILSLNSLMSMNSSA